MTIQCKGFYYNSLLFFPLLSASLLFGTPVHFDINNSMQGPGLWETAITHFYLFYHLRLRFCMALQCTLTIQCKYQWKNYCNSCYSLDTAISGGGRRGSALIAAHDAPFFFFGNYNVVFIQQYILSKRSSQALLLRGCQWSSRTREYFCGIASFGKKREALDSINLYP